MRKQGRTRKALLIALLLAVAVFAVVTRFLNRYGDNVIDRIEEQTGLVVEGEGVRLSFYGGLGFRGYDMKVRADEGALPFIEADGLFVGLDLFALLGREVRIDKIHLHGPKIKIVRSSDGGLAILDYVRKKGTTADGEAEDSASGMDQDGKGAWKGLVRLKELISVEDGEISFWDYSVGVPPFATKVRDLDIRLRRGLGHDGTDILLSARVEGDGNDARIRVEGALSGLLDGPGAGRVRFDVDCKLKDADLSLFMPYLVKEGPVKNLRGLIDLDFVARGEAEGTVDLDGELSATAISLEVPGIYRGPRSAESLFVSGEFSFSKETLLAEDVHVVADDIAIEGFCRLTGLGGEDVRVEAEAKTGKMPIVDALRYVPLANITGKTWPFLVEMIKAGTVRIESSRFDGLLADFTNLSDRPYSDIITARLDLKGVAVDLPMEEEYLPGMLTGVIGLADGILTFEDFSGRYGRTDLNRIDGFLDPVYRAGGILRLEVAAEPSLPEMMIELQHEICPDGLREIAAGLDFFEGKTALEMVLQLTTEKPTNTSAAGCVHAKGVDLVHDELPKGLSALQGEVCFDDDGVKMKELNMLFGEDPVRLTGDVNWNAPEGTETELIIDAKDLNLGGIEPLIGFEGVVKLEGPASGTLRIVRRGDTTESFGEVNPAGVTVTINQPWLSPFEGLRGRLKHLGREQEIESLKGTIGGNAFELSGKMTQREGFGLTFKCASPYLDMAKLFLQPDSPEMEVENPGAFEAPSSMDVRIEGDIHADRGTFREIAFEPVDAKLVMDRGVLRTDVTADFDGGGLTGCVWVNYLHAEGRRFGLCLSAVGMDLATLLKSLGSEESILEGMGDITGTLEGLSVEGEPIVPTLNGKIEVVTGEGVLKRLEVLARILTLVDASKWFTIMPGDLSTQGMPCRRISGTFEIVDGIASTQDLVIEANAMRLSAVGSIDLVKKTMDMTVGFQPLGNFDTVVDQLPIVGHILTGEGRSLIVFAFRLDGPIEEPRIRPVSLESVGRGVAGILGRLLQLPQDLVGGSLFP